MKNKTPKRGIAYVVVAAVFLMVGVFATYFTNQDIWPKAAALESTSAAESTFPPAEKETAAEPTFPVVEDEAEADSEPAPRTIDSGLNYYNPVMDIADHCGPAVVGVVNNSLLYDPYNRRVLEDEADSGSGVIISEDGYIITNHHVIESVKETGTVSVVLPGGKETIEAEIIGSDAVTDIAVLKIDKTGLPYVTFGDSDLLRQGELVVAIGNPLGRMLQGTVTVGYVSALNRTDVIDESEGEGYIQTDASINPGNSGGGLFNDKGELVGITSAKMSSNPYSMGASIEGLSFAIPSNQVKEIADQLIENGSVDRPDPANAPYMGVNVGDVDHSDFSPAGIFVSKVIKDSPAQAAGIRVNDVITSIDGIRTEDYNTLRATLANYQYGDTIEVEVYRNRKPVFLELTFFEMEEEKLTTEQ